MQICATLSCTNAEYAAAGDVLREALFVEEVLFFLVPGIEKSPVAVVEDFESAIRLAGNPLSSARSCHTDACHHFLREKVVRRV